MPLCGDFSRIARWAPFYWGRQNLSLSARSIEAPSWLSALWQLPQGAVRWALWARTTPDDAGQKSHYGKLSPRASTRV